MLLRTLFRRSTSLLSLSGQATMSTQVPSSLWKLGRLNHVAIATPDLLKSVSLYRDIMGAAVRYIIFTQGCCKGQKSGGAGSNVACGGVPPPPGGAFYSTKIWVGHPPITPLSCEVSQMFIRCGHFVRDFESEAKTRCNFQF